MKARVISALCTVVSAGVALCLLVGLLVLAAFLAAFFLGGEAAAAICAVLSRYVLPNLYLLGTILSIIGIVKMYLCGEKRFMLDRPGSAEETRE